MGAGRAFVGGFGQATVSQVQPHVRSHVLLGTRALVAVRPAGGRRAEPGGPDFDGSWLEHLVEHGDVVGTPVHGHPASAELRVTEPAGLRLEVEAAASPAPFVDEAHVVEIAQLTGTDQAADLLSSRQTAKAHVGAAQGDAVLGGQPCQILGLFDVEGERLLIQNGTSGRHRGRDQLVMSEGRGGHHGHIVRAWVDRQQRLGPGVRGGRGELGGEPGQRGGVRIADMQFDSIGQDRGIVRPHHVVSCDGARTDQHHSSHAATLHFHISRKFLSR
ncbi:hypothetical protein GCM10022420_081400 [Streptomyces iranensis]